MFSSKWILSALIGASIVSAQVDLQQALNLSVKFYGAQRSGTVDSNWLIKQYPDAKKAPCFPRDGEWAKVDLRGGWHDAGDNIKFTLTTAWAAYSLLKAYDAFPSAFKDEYNVAYGAPNGIPDVLDEVKWATDYLLKAHLDSATLVTQVGDARDHDAALTCPTMSKEITGGGGEPRLVWYGNSYTDKTGAKADILGITAAALGLMAQQYKTFDAKYADSCVHAAKQLYATAVARKTNTLEPNDQGFYKPNGFMDDLMCASVEIYRATGESNYLNESVSYAVTDHNWVVDWNDHHDYCWHSLAKAGKSAHVEPFWTKAVTRYQSKISSQTYIKGMAFFANWGTLSYATASAFSAALYDQIYTNPAALQYAKSQAEYVYGNNEYNRSFVVGLGNNPPVHPHHKNAFGYDDWLGSQPNSLYQLPGALVGGPHLDYNDGYLFSPSGYQDIITDYLGNEVSISYNSGLVGLNAAMVATQQTLNTTPVNFPKSLKVPQGQIYDLGGRENSNAHLGVAKDQKMVQFK